MQPDAQRFLDALRPELLHGDPETLAEATLKHGSLPELVDWLEHEDSDVRHAAAFVLGFVGHGEQVPALLRCLQDEDPHLIQFAENSLWSIWFRGGAPGSADAFSAGVNALAEERLDTARQLLRETIRQDPHFAEAYNQLAICNYLLNDFDASRRGCQQAVAINPKHFGAWAGMGHCYLHEGDVSAAAACYRRALVLHPHLANIREALNKLESAETAVSE